MSNEFPGNVFVSRNYPPPQNITQVSTQVEPVPAVTGVATSVTVTASESVNLGGLIDSGAAAEILGITTNNLRQMVHKGRLIPASKDGRRNMFARADVIALKDKRVK